MRDRVEGVMMEEKYFILIRQVEMNQIIHPQILQAVLVRGVTSLHLEVLTVTVQAVEVQKIVQCEMILEAETQTAGGDNVVL
jgi:hypothetical protein